MAEMDWLGLGLTVTGSATTDSLRVYHQITSGLFVVSCNGRLSGNVDWFREKLRL